MADNDYMNTQEVLTGIKTWVKKEIGTNIYDISANHDGAKYADLSAALGTNGANIPQSLRKGGMSVKFIQTSDNKYVQYRLMANEWSITVTDWQGVDEEPIAVSKNLVESAGIVNYIQHNTLNVLEASGLYCNELGRIYESTANFNSFIISTKGLSSITIKGTLPLYSSQNQKYYIGCYDKTFKLKTGYTTAFLGLATSVTTVDGGVQLTLLQDTEYIIYTYNIDGYISPTYIDSNNISILYVPVKKAFSINDNDNTASMQCIYNTFTKKKIIPEINNYYTDNRGKVYENTDVGEYHSFFVDIREINTNNILYQSGVLPLYASNKLYVACYNQQPSGTGSQGTAFLGLATLLESSNGIYKYQVPNGTEYIICTFRLNAYSSWKDSSIMNVIGYNNYIEGNRSRFASFDLIAIGHSIWWYDGRTLNPNGFMGGVTAKAYPTLIDQHFHFNSIINYSISGTSLASTSSYQGLMERSDGSATWQENNHGIWFLDTSANDWGRNVVLGTTDDYDNNTGYMTFYGALRLFKDRIDVLAGGAPIIICSNALQRSGADENSLGLTLLDYGKAVMYAAAKNNWYFVDQYHYGSITKQNVDYCTLDGLHPNNFGYSLAIKPWIEQLQIVEKSI